MTSQVGRYEFSGYPHNNGLVETGVLLRRKQPEVATFNERWWAEIRQGSLRDQLSFNYVAWRVRLKYGLLPGKVQNSAYTRLTPHRRNVRS
jgi:hypothetical protein